MLELRARARERRGFSLSRLNASQKDASRRFLLSREISEAAFSCKRERERGQAELYARVQRGIVGRGCPGDKAINYERDKSRELKGDCQARVCAHGYIRIIGSGDRRWIMRASGEDRPTYRNAARACNWFTFSYIGRRIIFALLVWSLRDVVAVVLHGGLKVDYGSIRRIYPGKTNSVMIKALASR